MKNTSLKPSYIESLDNVRGYAAIMVMLFHGANKVFYGGWVGVDLFFVLSGYLITNLLYTEYEKTGGIALKNFYLRRFKRLLPALLLGVLLAFILWPFSNCDPAGRSKATMASLFYYTNLVKDNVDSNMRHFWSLAVEEHFYFLWPITCLFFLFKLSHKNRVKFIVFLLIAVTIFRIYVYNNPMQYGPFFLHGYFFTLCRIDCILMGSLMALVLGEKKKRGAIITIRQNNNGLLLTYALLFAVLIFTLRDYNPFFENGGFVLTNLLCVVTVLFALRHPGHPLLTNKIMQWVGKRSYGLYVFHAPIFKFVSWNNGNHSAKDLIAITLLRFVLTVVIAALSYKYIEQPVLNFKKRFSFSDLYTFKFRRAFSVK